MAKELNREEIARIAKNTINLIGGKNRNTIQILTRNMRRDVLEEMARQLKITDCTNLSFEVAGVLASLIRKPKKAEEVEEEEVNYAQAV